MLATRESAGEYDTQPLEAAEFRNSAVLTLLFLPLLLRLL